jgi:bifunctional oligoribonuclease and PAP phosphatase NrnA
MKYQLSKDLLEVIEKSDKILINMHRRPDADSVGSATSMYKVLTRMGKSARIVSPNQVSKNLEFMTQGISVDVIDFDKFDFSGYQLFIMLDSASLDRVFSAKDPTKPDIKVINIDNHETNPSFGDINLLDFDSSSVCEMLFNIYNDWGQEIDSDIATRLLSGIEGDTGSFQFEVHKDTFLIAGKLLEYGADFQKIISNLFASVPAKLMEFWRICLGSMKLHPEGFVSISIPYNIYKDYVHLPASRETVATNFVAQLEGARFGYILTEDQPNAISVSFRSRNGVDVGKIALQIGGGGHFGAAGAHMVGISFDEACQKLENICKSY